MQGQGQLVTLRDGAEAKALVAPELGGWLLRYSRHLPVFGYVDALHFGQDVVDRYPNQMYAGNPLLFPQVSFTHIQGQEHHYQWQGQTYALPQHGFARRSRWRVVAVDDLAVLMELTDSAETRQSYPFRFRARVRYSLQNGGLHFEQTVENTGDRVLPFSTGIHPYLPVPIVSGGRRNDCYVELPAARAITEHNQWESWTAADFPAQRLPVSEDVSGTLLLTDLQEPKVSLVDPKAKLRIVLDWTGAPRHRFLAIWSKNTADPFYCVEPWTALPNSFSRKESELTLLPPGETFRAAMRLAVEAF